MLILFIRRVVLVSKQMKIIMENWRKSVLTEEEDKITTIGDLLKSLQLALKAKKQKIQKDALKDTGAGMILNLIPGAGSIKTAFNLVKTLYKLPDDKRTNTGLDNLQVDDQVSAVVDDRIENKFLQDTIERLMDLDPEFELRNLDMTALLSQFIKEKYGGTKVEKENQPPPAIS